MILEEGDLQEEHFNNTARQPFDIELHVHPRQKENVMNAEDEKTMNGSPVTQRAKNFQNFTQANKQADYMTMANSPGDGSPNRFASLPFLN